MAPLDSLPLPGAYHAAPRYKPISNLGGYMIRTWSGRLATALSVACIAMVPVSAQAPGVQWETTSQPIMPGLPFAPPPMKLKICAHATWTAPPPSGDQTCTNSNFQIANGLATWDTVCTGEMAMTGRGEIQFDPSGNSYTGQIVSVVEGMTMTVKLTGKKIGTCDNPR